MNPSPREPDELARLLDAAARRLQRAAADASPARLAERLWQLVRADSAARLRAGLAAPPTPEEAARFEGFLARAEAGEPLAYLEGSVGFLDLEFLVGPGALVPRADSECLVELILEQLPQDAVATIVDLGVGSGCLLFSLLHHRPRCRGVGVDRSPEALRWARRNRAALGLQARAHLLRGDWLASLAPASADLVVANPPYVEPGEQTGFGVAEHEPAAALYTPPGEPLEPYLRILEAAPRVLRPAGCLLFEVGAGRAGEVAAAGEAAGFRLLEARRDLGGIERAVLFRRPV
jgi:release factor glutamine methyltransferase